VPVKGSTTVEVAGIGSCIESVPVLAHGADPRRDAVRATRVTDRLALISGKLVAADAVEAAGSRTERTVADAALDGRTGVSRLVYHEARLAEVATGRSGALDAIGDVATRRHAALPVGGELVGGGTLCAGRRSAGEAS
jgi:hypothetical protein